MLCKYIYILHTYLITFIQSQMQYDSTGMYHWCPSRNINDCLMDRQEAAMTILQVSTGKKGKVINRGNTRITLSFVAEKMNYLNQSCSEFCTESHLFYQFLQKKLPKKVIQLFVICFHGLFGLGCRADSSMRRRPYILFWLAQWLPK